MKEKKRRKIKIGYIFALVVIVAVIGVSIFLILPGTGSSKYGDRLEGIEKISFNKKAQTKITDKIKSNENVTKTSLDIKGRIIYIIYNVKSELSLDDSKKIADESLEVISDEVKSYYDIQYIVTKNDEKGTTETKTTDDGETKEVIKKEFPIMGYKNSKSSKIVW